MADDVADAVRLAAALLGSAPAQGAGRRSHIDLLLVLAVDASGSVNQTRFELQRHGYADAFRNQQVLNAIRGGSTRSIAVTMVQWTGPAMQVQVVPWTLVKDDGVDQRLRRRDRSRAAATVRRRHLDQRRHRPRHADPAERALQGFKRVIDVSGDGSNNRGRDVRDARDEAVRAGVIINGLPIVSLESDLDSYYFDNVIGGPGRLHGAGRLLRHLLRRDAAQADPGDRVERP